MTTLERGTGNPSHALAHESGGNSSAQRFDTHFTQNVINATGPKASPRMRKVMASMIQHIHDFARENEITVEEWMAGVEMVMITPSFDLQSFKTET